MGRNAGTDRIFAELSAGGSQDGDGAGRPFEIYELVKSRTVRALAPRLPVSRLYRNDFAMVTEYRFCLAETASAKIQIPPLLVSTLYAQLIDQ